MPVHDVFVSYSEKDKPVADAVVAGLEQDGIRCWIAPRDIAPGTSWGDAIVEAISGSRVMVLVLSANSNGSRQVIREVERAVANDVAILPFRIDSTDPTGAMAYFLGTEHWLDAVTPPLQVHIDRLGTALKAMLMGVAPEGPLDQPPPVLFKRHRRFRSVFGLVIGVVVVAAAVTVVVLTSASDAPTSDAAATPATALDTTTPTSGPTVSLSEVTRYPTSRAANGLAISGRYLAIANGDDGIVYMSIADPAQLRIVAEYAAPGAKAVALVGNRAHVVGGDGLGARDFSVIDMDTGMGYTMTPPGSGSPRDLYGVFAEGQFAYLESHNYVGIIDLVDPTSPVVAFEWEPPGHSGNPTSVAVVGDIGYFGAGWSGLFILDLSDRYRPVEIGAFDTPDWVIDLVVINDVAYLTLGDSGLATLDVSDPGRPVLLDRVDLPGFASPLAVANGIAFAGVSGGDAGSIAMVDVSDPEGLRLIDTEGRYDLVTDVAVANGHLFVTEEARGLFVFEISTAG